jgi:hypothetical protein
VTKSRRSPSSLAHVLGSSGPTAPDRQANCGDTTFLPRREIASTLTCVCAVWSDECRRIMESQPQESAFREDRSSIARPIPTNENSRLSHPKICRRLPAFPGCASESIPLQKK